MKWASIIPLIGGQTLGCMNTYGNFPEYILSFNGFQENDKHCVHYLRQKGWNGQYYILDSEDTKDCIIPNAKTGIEFYQNESSSFGNIDVINAVPPCAGLSSLSRISESDSNINDWMKKCSDIVLSKIKPKVFFGENAWYLATEKGRGVADDLYKIAKENNYSFLVFQTETRFLGNPQKRPRTFFFFFDKEYFQKTPVLDFIDKSYIPYREFLTEQVSDSDKMNIFMNPIKVSDTPWYQCINDSLKAESYIEFIDKLIPEGSENEVNLYKYCLNMYKDDLFKLSEWLREHGFEREASRVERAKAKFDSGKGAWTHDINVGKYQIPGFVVGTGANGNQASFLAHPTEDRFLTLREMMRLMGLPDDFNLCGEKPHKDTTHISQNVCVHSAELMAEQTIKFINRTNDNFTDSDYIIQKHKQESFEDRSKTKVRTLEDFI